MALPARLPANRRTLLLELALLVTERQSLGDVFAAFAQSLVEFARFDYASLLVLEPDRPFVRVVGAFPAEAASGGSPTLFPANDAGMEHLPAFPQGVWYNPADIPGEALRLLAEAGIARMWSVPLLEGSVCYGSFNVGSLTDVGFREEDLEFLRLAGRLLAGAARDEWRIVGARQEAARNGLAAELALLLNAGKPVDALFELIASVMSQAVEFDQLSLHVRGAEGFQEVGAWPPQIPIPAEFDPNASIANVLAAGLTIAEYRTDRVDIPGARALHASGIARGLAAVLTSEGEPIGLLNLGRSRNIPFQDTDHRFLEVVSALLSQAVAGAERTALIQRETSRRGVLNELAILLNAGEPVETLFDRLPAMLDPVLGFDYIGLLVAADQPRMLRVVGSRPEFVRPAGAMVSFEVTQVDEILATGELAIEFRPEFVTSEAADGFRTAGIKRVLSVFLQERGETFGLLSLGRARNERFDPEDRRFIDLVTTILRQAVASQARLTRSEQAAARARVLNDLAVQIDAGEAVETIFARASEEIRGILPFTSMSLMVHEGAGLVRTVASQRGRVFPVGSVQDISGWGLDYRKLRAGRVVDFRPAGSNADAARLLDSGVQSLLAIAMVDGPEFTGLLNFARPPGQPFSEEETETLLIVGTLMGQAVAAQRHLKQTQAEAEEQRLIADAAAVVARSKDPSAIVSGLIEPIARLVPSAYVSFAYLRGENLVWVHRSGSVEMPRDRLSTLVLQEGQAAVPEVHDYLPESHPGRHLELHAASGTVAESAGWPVGLLVVDSREAGYTFGERELRLLRVLAQIVGPAMENARVAQETAHQRTLYELALSSLSDAVILIDHNLKATYANPAAQRIIQTISPDAADLAEAMTLITPEARTAVERAIESNQPGRGRTPFEIDGQVTWFDFEALPLDHPDYRLVIVASDVTSAIRREAEAERHQAAMSEAAERVERERATYNLALNSLSEAVVLLDHDYKTVFANVPGEAIVELVEPGLGPQSPDDAVSPSRQAVAEALARAARAHERSSGRTNVVLNGLERWLDFEFIPLDHPALAMLAVASDVTDTVEREAERERHRQQIEQASRLSALGELIGGVAHELNNPLTAVLGFTELISADPSAKQFADDLLVVHKEALRARNIVRDLLFIARPGTVVRSEVNISEVFAHIERLRRGGWTRRGIDVTLDTADQVGCTFGNEHQLTQVLLNLVTNAEQAMAETENPTLRISAAASGDWITIEVEDNGPGMSEEILGRIFEPFFTTKQGAGTGLGLSLSYNMVQAHGGRLEVESAPGAGACFRVVIPLSAPLAEEAPAEPGRDNAVARRVLVVDDEPSLRRVCQRLVQNLGHECETASSPAEAIRAAEAGSFDLVLCDYRLGSESADDVIAGFGRVRAELVARTVIATGATTDPGVVGLTTRFGLPLMAKPYGIAEIAALVGAIPA